MKKKRISVIMSSGASNEIRARMLEEGYSLMEKSKWFSEAIENFLELKEFYKLVETAGLIDDLTRPETISIPISLEEKLEDAIIAVRRNYPALEGVKSLIVRASVIRRLVLLPNKEKER